MKRRDFNLLALPSLLVGIFFGRASVAKDKPASPSRYGVCPKHGEGQFTVSLTASKTRPENIGDHGAISGWGREETDRTTACAACLIEVLRQNPSITTWDD